MWRQKISPDTAPQQTLAPTLPPSLTSSLFTLSRDLTNYLLGQTRHLPTFITDYPLNTLFASAAVALGARLLYDDHTRRSRERVQLAAFHIIRILQANPEYYRNVSDETGWAACRRNIEEEVTQAVAKHHLTKDEGAKVKSALEKRLWNMAWQHPDSLQAEFMAKRRKLLCDQLEDSAARRRYLAAERTKPKRPARPVPPSKKPGGGDDDDDDSGGSGGSGGGRSPTGKSPRVSPPKDTDRGDVDIVPDDTVLPPDVVEGPPRPRPVGSTFSQYPNAPSPLNIRPPRKRPANIDALGWPIEGSATPAKLPRKSPARPPPSPPQPPLLPSPGLDPLSFNPPAMTDVYRDVPFDPVLPGPVERKSRIGNQGWRWWPCQYCDEMVRASGADWDKHITSEGHVQNREAFELSQQIEGEREGEDQVEEEEKDEAKRNELKGSPEGPSSVNGEEDASPPRIWACTSCGQKIPLARKWAHIAEHARINKAAARDQEKLRCKSCSVLQLEEELEAHEEECFKKKAESERPGEKPQAPQESSEEEDDTMRCSSCGFFVAKAVFKRHEKDCFENKPSPEPQKKPVATPVAKPVPKPAPRPHERQRERPEARPDGHEGDESRYCGICDRSIPAMLWREHLASHECGYEGQDGSPEGHGDDDDAPDDHTDASGQPIKPHKTNTSTPPNQIGPTSAPGEPTAPTMLPAPVSPQQIQPPLTPNPVGQYHLRNRRKVIGVDLDLEVKKAYHRVGLKTPEQFFEALRTGLSPIPELEEGDEGFGTPPYRRFSLRDLTRETGHRGSRLQEVDNAAEQEEAEDENEVIEENNTVAGNADDDSDPDNLYVADMRPPAVRPSPVAVASDPTIHPRSPRVIISPRRPSPVAPAPAPAPQPAPPTRRPAGRPAGSKKKPKTRAPSSRASSVASRASSAASNDSNASKRSDRRARYRGTYKE